MKKTSIIIISIVLLIAIVIGIKMGVDKHMNNNEEVEMMEIVHSKEAEKVYKKTIMYNDPKAFTSEGVIYTYKIDDSSIEENPMGGIMVNLIINNDSDLVIDIILSKDSDRGELSDDAGGTSEKLERLLEKEGN
ncbi:MULTISPECIES: DUF1310 family protein [Listeria]|uniref:DUF1310 family protein n=1 Tax=Listeria TaxID=1637 RepID=UPI000B58C936|nr:MULTISPECIES: DUF1310 family protein [Listeria]